MSLDLAKRYPNLKFIVQDRPKVVKQATTAWERELPDALSSGRVQLMAHDFFTEQPVKNAQVYNLRYIMLVLPLQFYFTIHQLTVILTVTGRLVLILKA